MSTHTKPQPPPMSSTSPAIWPLVIADLAAMRTVSNRLGSVTVADMHARDAAGREKYGVPLAHDNGRDHAVDAYQEALDGCAYWRAEFEKTSSGHAQTLYRSALEHALSCRRYLLERDGR